MGREGLGGRVHRLASLSLGAERDFQWRLIGTSESTTLRLEQGSLLVMGGAMQTEYEHQVPARKRVAEARFNITFRRLRSQSPERSGPTRTTEQR